MSTSYTYALQTTASASGSVAAILHTGLSGLTIPTFNSLKIIGEITERVDAQAGMCELENIEVEFSEDYSVYSEGFWFKVINYIDLTDPMIACELQLTIDTGNGAEHLFWGVLVKENMPVSEFDMFSNIQRAGTLRFVSRLAKMRDIVTDTSLLIPSGELTNGEGYPASGINQYVEIWRVLESIFCYCMGQTRTTPGTYMDTLPANLLVSDFIDGNFTAPQSWYFIWNIVDHPNTYATDGTYGWNVRFGNFFDLFAAICKNLLVIPRHTYDPATQKHYLQLKTRTPQGGTNITLPTPLQSDFLIDNGLLANQMTSSVAPADETWSPGFGAKHPQIYWSAPGTVSFAQPNGFKSALDIPVEFYLDTNSADFDGYPFSPGSIVVAHHAGDYHRDEYHIVSTCRYLSTDGLTYVLVYGYGEGKLQEAILAYLNATVNSGRGYERTYPGITANNGSTDSHSNITYLSKTVINDGISDRTFVAQEVRKDVVKDELFVRWIEL